MSQCDHPEEHGRVAAKIHKELSKEGLDKHIPSVLKLIEESGDHGDKVDRIINMVTKLPGASFTHRELSKVLIDSLYSPLQELPASYLGERAQFRQPDGSYNNVVLPELGKAGGSYTRIVPPKMKANGVQPDPGQLFDLLMSRDNTFEPNEAGLSSLLFYYTLLIASDISSINQTDDTINDTSSYLDLSPLYGNNKEQQDAIRTFKGGELKPDTFAEKRFFVLPPGVNVLLVMYNRFHNFAARTLAAINEGQRFTPPDNLSDEEKQAWKDEKLFQVARLITNGLYVNTILHDFFATVPNVVDPNTHRTLDPQTLVDKILETDRLGLPKAMGNQTSVEINLVWRLYSLMSQSDAKWTEDLHKQLCPDKDPLNLSIQDLLKGISDFEQSLAADPSQRTFGGLKRSAGGAFSDADLVKILAQSIEEPAGRFGANHVPDVLKPIVELGIIQARKWQVASLNEFREFLGLEPHRTFEALNSDPYVSSTLKHLYGHVDRVELYPGIDIENKATAPGGRALTVMSHSTVMRALFSSGVASVRGDRFLTLDRTPANLTNWGFTEIAPDYEILGGAKMYQLILNAFPSFFKFNSVYAMRPFYTPESSRKYVEEKKIAYLFSFDPPSQSRRTIPILTQAGLKTVLTDQKNFRVPWGPKMTSLQTFMLASDTPHAAEQKEDVWDAVYLSKMGQDVNVIASKAFEAYSRQTILTLLKEKSYEIGRGAKKSHQVDIVKDVANLAAARFVAKLCYLPLNEKNGPSYTDQQLYKLLCDNFLYIFADSDPTQSWVRRRNSDGPSAKLVSEMEARIKKLIDAQHASGHDLEKETSHGKCPVKHIANTSSDPLSDFGPSLARRLLKSGRQTREVAEILVGLGVGFVANAGMLFTQLIDFYLDESRASHWSEIQRLAADCTPENDEKLGRYILEGYRLANTLALLRVVAPGSEVTLNTEPSGPITVKGGDPIFLSFITACRDPTAFPSPNEILLDRPIDAYITFGAGPHQCLGRYLNVAYARGMLKVLAGLPGLQRTPGDEGKLHFTTTASGLKLYLNSDWSELSPLPETMKLSWDATKGKEC